MNALTLEKKVCAVVVTFNRKELLIECLQGLLEQSRPLDAILIVDNASTDKTPEFLFENGFLSELPSENDAEPFQSYCFKKINSPIGSFDSQALLCDENITKDLDIYYVRMHENTGGAGGFYEGQKRAVDLGFEWLWLMDDDGLPSQTCLEVLLDKAVSSSLKAVNPLVIDKSNHKILSFGLAKNLMTVREVQDAKDDEGLILNRANPFNGFLLNKSLIDEIGLIKREMFIWGDESEYLKRILFHGHTFATIVDADFFHPTSKTNYKTKLFGLLRMGQKPEKLEMNFYRNRGYLNKKYGSLTSHRLIVKVFVFFILEWRIKKACKAVAYYFDGYFNRYKLKNFN